MALHAPSQLLWRCANLVRLVPAGSSQPAGRMGNYQPAADDRLTDASFRRYHAGANTSAAPRLPRIYCAHTRLLSMVAKAHRIKSGARKPVRQNATLQKLPQVALDLCRYRVYDPICTRIQPIRAPPR